MKIAFGKLEGSVHDGEKSMDITADDGLTLLGQVSVIYAMAHVGATRRKVHTPVQVEAYVNHAGLEFEIPAVPVIGGEAGLAAALRKAKATVTERVVTV